MYNHRLVSVALNDGVSRRREPSRDVGTHAANALGESHSFPLCEIAQLVVGDSACILNA